jgi:hypothetical protein
MSDNAIMWADLARDVVIVQGDDAGEFLHSQLANDIASLAVGSSIYSLLLEPTGDICAIVRVVRHADTVFTLDVEASYGEVIITRLQRFVLRAKVVMLTSDWAVRAFRGPNVNTSIGNVAGRALVYRGSNNAIDVVAEVSLLPLLGENVDAELIDYLRTDARWPKLGVDVLTGDIPATSGILDVAVSFTKGCYPGQELVERMASRGASAPVEVRVVSREGFGVGARIEKDGITVGTVTSIGPTLAMVRVARGSEVGEPLSVGTES